jgi:hypothetical protein
MEWLWTWGGKTFGFRDGDELWAKDGRHVGRFHGDEVYAPDGLYLGEVLQGRLITKRRKKGHRKGSFTPMTSRAGRTGKVDRVGSVMLAGYEDFPTAPAR